MYTLSRAPATYPFVIFGHHLSMYIGVLTVIVNLAIVFVGNTASGLFRRIRSTATADAT